MAAAMLLGEKLPESLRGIDSDAFLPGRFRA
jgi:hypothetical protein